MSGGAFDYAGYKTSQFAAELKNRLDEMGKDLDGLGYPMPTYSEDAVEWMRAVAAMAEVTGALMIEAEWLVSGDTSDETFVARAEKLMAQVEAALGK